MNNKVLFSLTAFTAIVPVTLILQIGVTHSGIVPRNPASTQSAYLYITATKGYSLAATSWAGADALWQQADDYWDNSADEKARKAEDDARLAENSARDFEDQGNNAFWEAQQLSYDLTSTAEEVRVEQEITQVAHKALIGATETALAPTPAPPIGSFERPFSEQGKIRDGRFQFDRMQVQSDQQELGKNFKWAVVNVTFWCDLESDEVCDVSDMALELRGKLGRRYTPIETNISNFSGSVYGSESISGTVVFKISASDSNFLLVVDDQILGRKFFVPIDEV